jgi:hypothetical protein
MSPTRWPRGVSVLVLALACLTDLQLIAQQRDATVTFKQVWKEAQPAEFEIVIHRGGQAEYLSQDKNLSQPQERSSPVESNAEQKTQLEDAGSQEAFKKDFQASDTLRQRIFSLAESVKFFDGQFDFTKHAIAQTGRKTLSYADPSRRTSTTYNYSEDPTIQELTAIFQGISTTIESGRKLDFDRRFDKLSLDQDLRALEEQSNEGRLYEVQAIAPLLQRLATDRTVLHIAQQRAERILKKAGLPVAPSYSQ